MPLEDVSHDTSMLDWLRHSGHGHLLAQDNHFSNHPPAQRSLSPPIIPSGYPSASQNIPSYSQSASFSQADNYHAQSYNQPPSSVNFVSSPTQFIAPHNNPQLDMDIENLKRDPNTRVVHRPPADDVVYRQRVFVRYLQPPTPPPSGAIIVREKQPPPPPPDPPVVIRRAPPPPPTPPPVVIRERPPPLPAPEPTTIINKIIPAPPPPPRQVIIEQYPPLPPKPQDVIIERWLPQPPRQRRILYERLPAPAYPQPVSTAPIIVQHGLPRVRIHRQIINEPGPQFVQQFQSTVAPSSLVSYSPYSTIQQSHGVLSHPQSNVVVLQNDASNLITSSSYGLPLSCVCSPNTITGLDSYGSGISTIPTIGYLPGQSSVYTVPQNASIDNILRQLGVDPYSIQQSSDPHSAVQHVWNAATHANLPHTSDPTTAVQHVWNAAAHAVDHNQFGQQQPPPPHYPQSNSNYRPSY